MTPENKRRHILIDRLQYHLLGIHLFYTAIVALVFAALLFGPLIQQLLLSDLEYADRSQASEAFLILHQRIWPPLIIAFVCLTIHSLTVSHRIAGPLYQFRRLFARLRDGDLTVRARLRRRDYLTAEAEIINEMSASLERKLLETQRHGLDLCVGLDGLKKELLRGDEAPSPHMCNVLQLLDDRADRFRRSIVAFKTAPDSEHADDPVRAWSQTPTASPPRDGGRPAAVAEA